MTIIRQILFIPAMIFELLFSNIAAAGDDDRNADRRAFVGLWQGIDSFDGSTQFLSITCASRKSCDVRLNDTSFELSCPNPPQTGFARDEGSIKKERADGSFDFGLSKLDCLLRRPAKAIEYI